MPRGDGHMVKEELATTRKRQDSKNVDLNDQNKKANVGRTQQTQTVWSFDIHKRTFHGRSSTVACSKTLLNPGHSVLVPSEILHAVASKQKFWALYRELNCRSLNYNFALYNCVFHGNTDANFRSDVCPVIPPQPVIQDQKPYIHPWLAITTLDWSWAGRWPATTRYIHELERPLVDHSITSNKATTMSVYHWAMFARQKMQYQRQQQQFPLWYA